MFGSSGHVTRPQGSTLAAYSACYPLHHMENHHVKAIANMAYVDCVGGDPHHFTYLVGASPHMSAVQCLRPPAWQLGPCRVICGLCSGMRCRGKAHIAQGSLCMRVGHDKGHACMLCRAASRP